jgi:hypothetical protein
MKAYLTAVIFLVYGNTGHAQTDIINITLISQDADTAYVGIENSFEITASGKGNYELRAGFCQIQKTSKPDHYIVKPHAAGIDTFYVIQDGKAVFSKIFRLIYLPLPRVQIGSLNKKTASKEEIIAGKELIPKIYNCKCSLSMEITGYILTINTREGKKHIPVNGNLLSEKAIGAIELLAGNDSISFDDIKARGADDRSIALPSFSITIR